MNNATKILINQGVNEQNSCDIVNNNFYMDRVNTLDSLIKFGE